MKARALCSCCAAVLRASVAVLVCVVCQPARADDEEVCKKGKGEEAVAACTRILDLKSSAVNHWQSCSPLGDFRTSV